MVRLKRTKVFSFMLHSPIDEIKSKLDIVEFIQGYIRLQKAGRNYRALCPFHSEKTPSFMVSPERQLWKCFGCGKGGSVFDFVMEMEGLEFGEALRLLAQRAGVELKKIDPQLAATWRTEKTRLYEICDLASRFFIKQLTDSKTGQTIQKYLFSRGLKPAILKDWRLGYAPKDWQGLSDFLKSRRYTTEEIIKAGLAVKKDDGSIYDRFRDRIIFPINDLNGQVIGFSGRENPDRPQEQMGKYINTPNTPVYDKSRVLYGLDKAKMEIKKQNLCVLVEGQMDIILSHQAGVKNTVASSGTALTEDHLKIIKRYTDNLATAFDMDLAGENATKKGVDLAIQQGFNTKIISLSNDKDPADCASKNPEAWVKAISQAEGIMEFYLKTALAKYDSQTGQGKKEISKIILPVIKQMPNKIEQGHWLQEIARQLKTPESSLVEEMRKIKDQGRRMTDNNYQVQTTGHLEKPDLEEYALGLLLGNINELPKVKNQSCSLFSNHNLALIFNDLKKCPAQEANLKSIQKKTTPELSRHIDYLVFKTESHRQMVKMDETNQVKPSEEIIACFNQLRNRHWHRKLNQLCLDIKEAEDKGDKTLIKKLSERFNKLSKKIN